MLQHLSIDGLAIIEHLEIDFEPGFNVITGETGAGKSILIKALSLLFGPKLVRKQCVIPKNRPPLPVSLDWPQPIRFLQD